MSIGKPLPESGGYSWKKTYLVGHLAVLEAKLRDLRPPFKIIWREVVLTTAGVATFAAYFLIPRGNLLEIPFLAFGSLGTGNLILGGGEFAMYAARRFRLQSEIRKAKRDIRKHETVEEVLFS